LPRYGRSIFNRDDTREGSESPARPLREHMDDYAENARGLARAMLDAGRPFEWVLMMAGAYFGERGREAALSAIEEREELASFAANWERSYT
jgi:hypothetical protein